jgi:hypothetical protein
MISKMLMQQLRKHETKVLLLKMTVKLDHQKTSTKSSMKTKLNNERVQEAQQGNKYASLLLQPVAASSQPRKHLR